MLFTRLETTTAGKIIFKVDLIAPRASTCVRVGKRH
jgi:hypothetical protein